ncbi:YdaS family helix-turn-helix protein [Sphingomonas sp. XXL09]|uniref:YdaS family helix-turn-helix protein n=1 Tax=Sphingomonas sp. XXL09 TaxID=3457787 RepID=UPI00406BD155
MAADALAEAVQLLNGQSATARLLKVSQQAVSAKLASGKVCSAKWVLPLEAATGVSRHRLRPDLYPSEHLGGPQTDLLEAAR